MKDEALPDIPPTPGDDLNGFDRTLAAYCTAYEIDASNIVYGVATDVEDAPQFQLYAPAHPRRQDYSDLELLAVLRALRWNDAFCSISFRGISLDSLASVLDLHGAEYEPKVERSGRAVNLKMASQGAKNLLVHELRALALYTGKLRRMDFYECIKNGNVSSGSCSPVEPGCDRACPIVVSLANECLALLFGCSLTKPTGGYHAAVSAGLNQCRLVQLDGNRAGGGRLGLAWWVASIPYACADI